MEKSDRGCKSIYILKDGQLEVRFCASGATIQAKTEGEALADRSAKKHAVVHYSTSADVKAKHLEQEQILVATMSGDIEIGEFVAEEGDLSSGSGDITLDNMQVQEAAITTASGDVDSPYRKKVLRSNTPRQVENWRQIWTTKKPETSMYLVMEKPI